jgi:hypothetical protein
MTQGRRVAIALTLALTIASCASSEKTRRYELAREYINRIHQAAYFGPSTPWLLTESQAVGGAKLADPTDVIDALLDKYFAATESAVSSSCNEHYFACGDPMAFEFLVRSLHNREIMSSKEAKLSNLQQWINGGESDRELFTSLGVSKWTDLENRAPASGS